MLPETPHFAISPEAKIRTAAFDLNLSNQHPSGIPDIDTVPATAVHITIDIRFDAVRGASVRISEDTTISQVWSIVFPENRVGIDGGSATVVSTSIAMYQVGIRYVDSAFIGRETYAVWSPETISYDSNISSTRIETVNKLGELRFGPKTLLVAVDRVRKPNRAVRVDDDVIR